MLVSRDIALEMFKNHNRKKNNFSIALNLEKEVLY